MRLFVLLLVLVNLAIFAGYNYLFKPQQQTQRTELPVTASADSSIILIAERNNERFPIQPVQSQLPTEQIASVESQPSDAPCFEIFPISSEADLRQLQTLLKPYQIVVKSEKRSYEAIANHWVYIPSLPSTEQGKILLRQLRAAGITDVYMIEAGPNKNAISLGLFRKRSAAETRVARLAKNGFEVELLPRMKTVDAYALTTGPMAVASAEQYLQQVTAMMPEVKYQTVACQ